MEQYKTAIRNAAQELPKGYALSDTLISKLVVACEAENDAPAHYFSIDELLKEFQLADAGSSMDDAFSKMMGYAKKALLSDVSPEARINVLRVIVGDGMFPGQFYAGLEDQASAELKTREAVVSAMGLYAERGNGSDDAWICNNYGYLRQVLRKAREELNQPLVPVAVATPVALLPEVPLRETIPENLDDLFNDLFSPRNVERLF